MPWPHVSATQLMICALSSLLILAVRLQFMQRIHERDALPVKKTDVASGPARAKCSSFSAVNVPENLDVIIIGSGVSGLCTAVTLAKQGNIVCVLEQHDKPGGCCHSYVDRGFEFDTGLHYVGGEIWNDTGRRGSHKLMDLITDNKVRWKKMGCGLSDPADISTIANVEMKMPAGKDSLKQAFLDAFPDEGVAIEMYFAAIQKQQAAAPLFFIHKCLPKFMRSALAPLMQAGHIAMSDVTTLEMLQSLGASAELVGRLTYHFGNIGYSPAKSSFANTAMMAQHYHGGGAYPIGGPSTISQACIEAIQKRGGAVLVRAKVDQILINHRGAVCGVQVRKGGKAVNVSAPIVVSAVGVRCTFCKLVPQAHRPSHILEELGRPGMSQSSAHLSLCVGLDGSAADLQLPSHNHWISPSHEHDENQRAWESWDGSLGTLAAATPAATFLSFPSAKDPDWTRRHPGKSTCHIIVEAPYAWFSQWRESRIHRRGEEYTKIKRVLAEKMLNVMYEYYPQTRGRVKLHQLGTPLSSEFYLGASGGSSYGLAPTCDRFRCDWLTPEVAEIPGLYLTGQDIVSGGVTGALLAGFLTAIVVCKRVLWTQWEVVMSL